MFEKLFKRNDEQIYIEIKNLNGFLMVNLFVNNKRRAYINCSIENDIILIGDIRHESVKYYNRGYATKMMEGLINYAKENGLAEICGNLSVVDLEHKDRLHHFYEKFGFDIKLYTDLKDNTYYGRISKRINN